MIGTCYLKKDASKLDKIRFAHGSAVVAWTPVFTKFGALIPMNSVDASVSTEFYRKGRFNFKIATGITVVQGDQLYFTAATGNVTTTAPAIISTACFYLGRASAAGDAVGSATAGYVDVELADVTGSFSVSGSVSAAYEGARISFITSATSGILRGINSRIYFTVAGTATGEAGRFYTQTDVSIANMHGIHATAQLGSETVASVGSVTGEASGVRGTIGIGLTNTAPAGGTLAAVRADSYFLSSAAGAASSFFYAMDVSTTFGVDAFLRIGACVNRQSAKASRASGPYTYDTSIVFTGTDVDGLLKVITPDGTFYIPLVSTVS